MSAQTPGPWAIFHTGNVNMIIPANRDGMIADLIENEANAHLIAAAPDLLEACKKAIDAADWPRLNAVERREIAAETLRIINAAIAKAERGT